MLPGDVCLCSVSLSEVYGLKGNWFAMVFKTRAGGCCCALLQYSSLEKTIAKAETLTFLVMWSLLMHSAGVKFALFLRNCLLFLQKYFGHWTILQVVLWLSQCVREGRAGHSMPLIAAPSFIFCLVWGFRVFFQGKSVLQAVKQGWRICWALATWCIMVQWGG